MSPSTKNLREKIEEILVWHSSNCTERNPCLHTEKVYHEEVSQLANLLSSELSLAVKGLREAVEEAINNHTPENVKIQAFLEILEAFDSKAKEILGESS